MEMLQTMYYLNHSSIITLVLMIKKKFVTNSMNILLMLVPIWTLKLLDQGLLIENFLSREFLIFMNPITDNEIIDAVNLCKPKTCCGWDNISMTVVKKTILNIVSPLSYLMNMSFSSGCVPRELKNS